MQTLVYSLIALASVAVAAAAYFGFTFTPIEAIMLALLVAGLAVIAMERTLRQRAETRLERAIEDLSRLLAIDSQAGQVLSQRINTLTDANAGKRLEVLEADISVLGTVVRQVAEAVSEFEDKRSADGRPAAAAKAPEIERQPEPVVPLEMVKDALAQNRLLFHVEPVVTLPQRRLHGYDLVPRLLLEDGELAPAADFMPVRGAGGDIVRSIEGKALEEGLTTIRRARTNGMQIVLYLPLSRPSLADKAGVDQIHAMLTANKAMAPNLNFTMSDADWQSLLPSEKQAVTAMARNGALFSLSSVRSLRLDFAELAGLGVRSVRIDATRFIDKPEFYTDFHSSDIAGYLQRFGITLLATGIQSEQQIISLLEDGIGLAQGPHIAVAGPLRADLTGDGRKPLAEVRRATT